MKLHMLGIDIGKAVFHLVGMDESGKVPVKKRCSRSQLLHYAANLSIHVIGMEACSGAHFLAPELNKQGHEVRLMPAQYVKPFVKTNKNDFNDVYDRGARRNHAVVDRTRGWKFARNESECFGCTVAAFWHRRADSGPADGGKQELPGADPFGWFAPFEDLPVSDWGVPVCFSGPAMGHC